MSCLSGGLRSPSALSVSVIYVEQQSSLQPFNTLEEVLLVFFDRERGSFLVAILLVLCTGSFLVAILLCTVPSCRVAQNSLC